jgi:hypothetical protein
MCRSDSIGSLQSEVMRKSWAASRYHHAAVDKRSTRNVVATAADSHEDAMRAGKVDGIDDVGNSGTLNDQCRVFVDERVVVPSGHIVVRITSTQYPALQTTFEFLDGQVVQVRRFDQLHEVAPFSPWRFVSLVPQCTKMVASQQRTHGRPSGKPLEAVSSQPIGLRTRRSLRALRQGEVRRTHPLRRRVNRASVVEALESTCLVKPPSWPCGR